MKMVVFFVVTFVSCLFLNMSTVVAYGCDYSDIEQYKKESQNVSVIYRLSDEKLNLFEIILTNITSNLNIEIVGTNDKVVEKEILDFSRKNDEYILKKLPEGGHYSIEITTTDVFCGGNLLRTAKIELPYYNPYYNDKLCDGLETLSLCQRWVNTKFDYDYFVKEVTKYKETNGLDDENENENSIYYGIFDFIIENIYFFLIGTVLIISIILIIFIIRKRRKRIS